MGDTAEHPVTTASPASDTSLEEGIAQVLEDTGESRTACVRTLKNEAHFECVRAAHHPTHMPTHRVQSGC